ncbi:MAG TPA: hypothetical protein VFX65_14770 [Candidatus Limnocylindrales bacterium]|nr:hypothetical protein [Candidatus Limnocylindrales bacterium]
MVSIGDTVRFQTTLENTDNSTISQLFLEAVTDASIYSFGTPLKYAVSITKNGAAVANGCEAGAALDCTVRNVRPGDVVQATVVYVVPATNPGTTEPYEGDASCEFGASIGYLAPVTSSSFPNDISGPALCVKFVWSTTGAPDSDGGASHGDVWNWYDGVAISDDLINFRSRYVYQAGQTFVANSQALSVANPHSTAAYAPATGIPVTVLDLACEGDETEGLCTTTNGWGEVSVVSVNGGELPAGATWFKFLIQADASEIPSGVNKNNVIIHHTYVDDGVTQTEVISDRCTISKQTDLPTNTNACLVVQKLAGNDLAITIYSLFNGTFRPGF